VPKLVLTSFRMASILRAGLGAVHWRALVVDESHILQACPRAADSQQTDAVCALARATPHVLLLSGTPSLSRPFGLWRQADLLRPGLYGRDKWAFGRMYCALSRTAAGRCALPHPPPAAHAPPATDRPMLPRLRPAALTARHAGTPSPPATLCPSAVVSYHL
jgi:hypothetical protein